MNTDKINEIIEKIPFTLMMVAFLGYLGFDYYSFVYDAASPLIAKQQELATTKAQTSKFEAKIKELNLFVKTLDVKRTQIRALAQELQDIKGSLPETLDIPSIMKMVITEAKKVGLRVLSLQPGEPSEKTFYSEQPFVLTYSGVFPQLTVFLERLSNTTEIVRVENLKIKADDPRRRLVEITGNVELKFYRYLGTKADSIGKSPASSTAPPTADSGASGPKL